MKALHIFPIFGSGIQGGAERYSYMLSAQLARLGFEVEVLATQASHVRHTSAFSLAWRADFDRDVEEAGGMTIRRFPVSFNPPARLGHILSWLMLERWRKEEREYGVMLNGSSAIVDYYHRRALARPAIYDWMTALARGPHSRALIKRLADSVDGYDVLLAGFTPFVLMSQVLEIAWRAGKPVVLLPLFHPEDVYHHFKPFYRCFGAADAIIAQTPYSAGLFTRLAPESKPVVVGAGVDITEFAEGAISGDRFRAKYGLGNKRIVLFVGRKERPKRYDLAVEAIDLIGDERIKLVLIGRDVDGLPIASPHAIHLGDLPRADLLDAYDACDLLLLPSEHESFGIVFLEAWMRRKPVIGNPAARAVRCVIRDGEDGFLCGSPEAMAERIAELIVKPELARAMGEAGYRKTIRDHTWQAVAKRVRGIYLGLIGKPKVPSVADNANKLSALAAGK